MSLYALTSDPNVVLNTQTGAFIPIVGNWMSDAYQAWLAAGNVPDPYVPPDTRAADIRAERDKRLAATDWTQLYDAKVTDAIRTTYATYRQALRDVTTQSTFPASVTWPTSPDYAKTAAATNPFPKYNPPSTLMLPSMPDPAVPPTGTAILYVEDGIPKVKTDTGTVTEIGDK